jgi:hypothetical protein
MNKGQHLLSFLSVLSFRAKAGIVSHKWAFFLHHSRHSISCSALSNVAVPTTKEESVLNCIPRWPSCKIIADTYLLKGRAIAQAVSRWLPTATARVRARVWSSGICGGHIGAGERFLRVLWFPLPIFIPPNSPSSFSGRRAEWTHLDSHSGWHYANLKKKIICWKSNDICNYCSISLSLILNSPKMFQTKAAQLPDLHYFCALTLCKMSYCWERFSSYIWTSCKVWVRMVVSITSRQL